MATKKTKKSTIPTTAGKTARRDAKSASSKRSKQAADQAISTAMDEFLEQLAKQPHVTILSREESRRIIENTEFDGCIARPKSTATNTTTPVVP